MYFKTAILLATFWACIDLSVATKCYVCAGSETSDCAKGKSQAMSVVNCKSPGAGLNHRFYSYFNVNGQSVEDEVTKFQPVCLKLYETDYEPKLYARGCGVFPSNIDACEFLEQHAHITGCKSCKTDLCNGNAQLFQEDDDLLNFIED